MDPDPKPKSRIDRLAELHKLRLDLERQQAQDIEDARFEDIPQESEDDRFNRMLNDPRVWR